MIVRDPRTNTVLRSARQIDLLGLIRKAHREGRDGLTFKEIYGSMQNRPRNDAGVRMALDTLEEKKLIERRPRRKYGSRGRFPGAVVRWYPTKEENGSPEKIDSSEMEKIEDERYSLTLAQALKIPA